jgi:proteasome lid subunit RPN8/RPN11
LSEGSLQAFIARATPAAGEPDAASDLPVFIPEVIRRECMRLARQADGIETGGFLVGHLRRDARPPTLFVQVTAQLPARHVDATRARLTFTSDTWTDFRSSLEARGRGEIALGWWHSHPVRVWCKDCPVERQRECSLRGDFLSADDRLLHRAMFPRGWCLALVVNDVAWEEPTLSLFGWRDGILALRSFNILDPDAIGVRHSHALLEVPADAVWTRR